MFSKTEQFEHYQAKIEQLTTELTEVKNELTRIQELKTEVPAREKGQDSWMQMAKMAAAGEIAGGVAHEINNPLQVIMGRVQIAKMGKSTLENLDIIEAQAKRIAVIVRGFRALARSETQSTKEVVNIQKIINDLIELIQGQFYKQNIQIEANVAEDLPILWGDATHIQQLLLNFILSAKKRIEQSGTIRILVKRENKRDLLLEIFDSGSILSKETRQKISESVTGAAIQDVNDSCLTLAVSAQMVRSIGGKVKIQSNSSNGNKIFITLPILDQKTVENGNNGK